MNPSSKKKLGFILNTKINALTFDETIICLKKWVETRESKYVCICNTHSLVTAYNNKLFFNALEGADICTPDGMPLVWALKLLGYSEQDRVDGPNLMLALCDIAAKNSYKIFLYGSTESTLEKLQVSLNKKFPNIQIVGSYSPPFRKLEDFEVGKTVNMINNSGANIIFVGLGCPKQELWMNENTKDINGVLIGVGAAFDFIAGTSKRPPIFIQKMGFEWLYRLLSEPKRLWRRYLYNNTEFIRLYVKTFWRNKQKTKLFNSNN